MLFDPDRFPPSINIVWIPIGILIMYRSVRVIKSGKIRNRGGTWTTRARSPLFFWLDVAVSLTLGVVCIVVGATYLSDLWRG
jgi:hypothetical protein